MDKEKASDSNRRSVVVALASGGFSPLAHRIHAGFFTGPHQDIAEAYAKMLQEPSLVDEAKKRGWELRRVGGDELEVLAKEVGVQPADVAERMKALMGK